MSIRVLSGYWDLGFCGHEIKFAFLEHDVDCNNNTGERTLRAFAEYRKILYGNRSGEGARRTKILMGAYAICKARNVNFYEFLKDYMSGRVDKIPASLPRPQNQQGAPPWPDPSMPLKRLLQQIPRLPNCFEKHAATH